jgi:hypothetical protein
MLFSEGFHLRPAGTVCHGQLLFITSRLDPGILCDYIAVFDVLGK